jgi:hypothetical protein
MCKHLPLAGIGLGFSTEKEINSGVLPRKGAESNRSKLRKQRWDGNRNGGNEEEDEEGIFDLELRKGELLK